MILSLSNFLNVGYSMSSKKKIGPRLSCWIGWLRANFHRNFSSGKGCCISPDAWIHPRGSRIRLGTQCSIGPGAMLQGNIEMGDNCSVQAYAILTGYPKGKITIGNGVRIASHTVFVAANHNFDRVDIPIYKQGLQESPIQVQDDVWIGSRVCVLSGVTIGKGSVIGAGSVVTKDIPPFSIAVGSPARVIRNRNDHR